MNAFVGFGTVEDFIEEMKQHYPCEPVRVDTIVIHGKPDPKYGIRIDTSGVMLALNAGDEILYAFIPVARVQWMGNTSLTRDEEEADRRTLEVYRRIVERLRSLGIETRKGVYSFPQEMRLVMAEARFLKGETRGSLEAA